MAATRAKKLTNKDKSPYYGALQVLVDDLFQYNEEVRRLDLIQALQLKSDLGLSTDGPELKAACATLPEALAKPRYDLEAQSNPLALCTRPDLLTELSIS